LPPPRQRRAQAANAPPDLELARRLLDQAERHLASAEIPGVDTDSKFGLLYDAARKSADAVLKANGRRVTQGSGHHIVFLAEAKRLLPNRYDLLVTRVEAARSIRNGMEYRAREVTELELAELGEAAAGILAAAREYVDAAGRSGRSAPADPV
jgi:hypothetical protein